MVFVFGTGRPTNTGTSFDLWNESYPYLAIHKLGDVTARTGKVFSHPIGRTSVEDARQIGDAVGARAEDKWVLVQGGRILVVTSDGRVFRRRSRAIRLERRSAFHPNPA